MKVLPDTVVPPSVLLLQSPDKYNAGMARTNQCNIKFHVPSFVAERTWNDLWWVFLTFVGARQGKDTSGLQKVNTCFWFWRERF